MAFAPILGDALQASEISRALPSAGGGCFATQFFKILLISISVMFIIHHAMLGEFILHFRQHLAFQPEMFFQRLATIMQTRFDGSFRDLQNF